MIAGAASRAAAQMAADAATLRRPGLPRSCSSACKRFRSRRSYSNCEQQLRVLLDFAGLKVRPQRSAGHMLWESVLNCLATAAFHSVISSFEDEDEEELLSRPAVLVS